MIRWSQSEGSDRDDAPDLGASLSALDPASADPAYWPRFRAHVIDRAGAELARRRRLAELTVADVLSSWSRHGSSGGPAGRGVGSHHARPRRLDPCGDRSRGAVGDGYSYGNRTGSSLAGCGRWHRGVRIGTSSEPMERQTRTRVVTAAVLAAVFGAGTLLGFAVDGSLVAEPSPAMEGATAETGESVATEVGEKSSEERRPVYTQVEPNEEQLARIEEIVKEHRARTNALDEEIRARYQAEFRVILLESRTAIKGVMTPEQAERYQELLDERYGPPGDDQGS